ncbi:YdeI/OmpD-associated family protein [Megamonas funiformis]
MSEKGFNIDIDILEELKKDEMVWANFHKFPSLYQRVRIDTIK